MNFNCYLLVGIAAVVGVVILVIGLFTGIYKRQNSFQNISTASCLQCCKRIVNAIEGRLKLPVVIKKCTLLRFSSYSIRKSQINISLERIFIYKIICLVVASLIILCVQYTNVELLKISIISKPINEISLFAENSSREYEKNAALYRAVLKNIGENALKNVDEKLKLERIKKELPQIMGTQEQELLDEKASMIAETFRRVQGVWLINFKTLIFMVLFFWLPEIMLLSRWLLFGSIYRKEVVKLESIFELLGTVKGVKTIDILSEMSKASRLFRKPIEACIEHFKIDRERALDRLKESVPNSRFTKLVDVLRVFSTTDRTLALQILERNRMESEEELLLTAEEDVDMVDLIAFVSIVPILLNLANLLMKPMLEMIYQAFNVV